MTDEDSTKRVVRSPTANEGGGAQDRPFDLLLAYLIASLAKMRRFGRRKGTGRCHDRYVGAPARLTDAWMNS